MVMGKYKKFDKQLFRENDVKARRLSIDLGKALGIVIRENPDKYGPDLIIEGNQETYYGECEIKHSWKSKSFPFPDINFPERKRKFAELDTKTRFIMFNSDCTACLYVDSHILLSSPLVEVRNKYIVDGEKFFKVPISEVKFLDLEEIL